MKKISFWNKVVIASLALTIIPLSISAEILNNVEKIENNPSFYHNREVRVESFIRNVKYIPHGERAILIIDLADEKPELKSEEAVKTDEEPELKPEEKAKTKLGKYLRCQDTGFNVGILQRIYDILKGELKKGKKIRVKGKYDANLDMLHLARITLFRNKKKYEIDPNLGDVNLLDFGKIPPEEYIVIKEGIKK